MRCPSAAAIVTPALGTFQYLCESVFAVFAACSNAIPGGLRRGYISAADFLLSSVEDLSADDGWVVVFDQIHGRLALVYLTGLGNAIYSDGLLEDAVAAVFFIFQNTHNHGFAEGQVFAWDLDILFSQGLSNHINRLSREEHIEYPFYDFSFIRHDLRVAIFATPVSKQFFIDEHSFTIFEVFAEAPCDITAHTLRFGLGEACVDD